MFPERRRRVFLDVDNLTDISLVRRHAVRSKCFALILIPGVLESASCQQEIAVTLETDKKVVVIQDVKNCPRPQKIDSTGSHSPST